MIPDFPGLWHMQHLRTSKDRGSSMRQHFHPFGESESWTLANGRSFCDATMIPTVGTLKRRLELCSLDDEELGSSITSSPLKKIKTGPGKMTQATSSQAHLRAMKQKIAARKIRPLPIRRLFSHAAKPVLPSFDPAVRSRCGKDHGSSEPTTSVEISRCFDVAVAIAKTHTRRTNIDSPGLWHMGLWHMQHLRTSKDRGSSHSATSDAISRYIDAAVAIAKTHSPRPNIEPEHTAIPPTVEFVIHEDSDKVELGTRGCSASLLDIVDNDDLSANPGQENVAPFGEVPCTHKPATTRNPLGDLDIAQFYPAVQYDSSDDEL
ncbi:hypothetical protein MMC07_003168 [Pseudocyphellaria aurata]|nr:hypothetical protein [Pseudocyphellaria aurata]